MQAGDRIIINTPGGGGWGSSTEPKNTAAKKPHERLRGSVADRRALQEGV